MASIVEHLAYLQSEYEAARAAPLSSRKTMLVAMLIDAYADRLFDVAAGDILEHRAELAAASPALRTIFELASGRARIAPEAITVPIAQYGELAVEDFMVSLYNDHTVQRLRIAMPGGERLDAHAVLADAIGELTLLSA